MDIIFMNSENSRTSKPHFLIRNLTDKIDLQRGKKALLYQIVVFKIHGKRQENHTTTISLKYQLQHGMINLNYMINQQLKTILNIF